MSATNHTTAPPVVLLKPKDIADQLKISLSTVYELIHAGQLPAVRISARANLRPTYRIPEDALRTFITSHTTGATP